MATLINLGAISLYEDEREALRLSAEDNSRSLKDQIRWYIRQGLIRDGYAGRDGYAKGGKKCTSAKTRK